MMDVALVQMQVGQDVKSNLGKMEKMVEQAASAGAQVVVLPEMFCCLYQTESFLRYNEPVNGQIWSALKETARRNKVYLIGGSMPEDGMDGHIYNTCFSFDPQGEQIGRHRKVHLFDVDIKNGMRFKESDTFTSGKELTILETPFGRLGIMICFDIRFPEWSRLLSLSGAEVIIVPAAFNMTTGPAHWQMSFKARALDNQVFMLGCSPARDETGPYVSYGHSIIAAPWGNVLAELDENEGLLLCQIDLGSVKSIREQLPLLKSMRKDLYEDLLKRI